MKVACAIFLAALLLLQAAPGEAEVSLVVLTPPAMAAVDGARVSIVLRVSSAAGAEEVAIAVNDGGSIPVEASPAGEVLCIADLPLAAGQNRLRITARQEGRVVAAKTVTVFRRSDLSPRHYLAPREFTRFSFHVPENEKPCASCHRRELGGVEAAASGPSSCTFCHRQMTDARFVHGPVAVGSCRTCHDLRAEKGAKGIGGPVEKLCAGCHEDSFRAWAEKKYLHGPTAMGSCSTCHDPHGSNGPYFLRLEATDLCSACHQDTASRPHVISGFSGGGHPVRLSPDPFHPERDFSCASCHDPHAENSPILLRNADENTPTMAFCLTCHRML